MKREFVFCFFVAISLIYILGFVSADDSGANSFWGDFGNDNSAVAATDTGATAQETGNNNIQKASEATDASVNLAQRYIIGYPEKKDTGIRFDFTDAAGKTYNLGVRSLYYVVAEYDGSITERRIVTITSDNIVSSIENNAKINLGIINFNIAGLVPWYPDGAEIFVDKADAEARSEVIKAELPEAKEEAGFWGQTANFLFEGRQGIKVSPDTNEFFAANTFSFKDAAGKSSDLGIGSVIYLVSESDGRVLEERITRIDSDGTVCYLGINSVGGMWGAACKVTLAAGIDTGTEIFINQEDAQLRSQIIQENKGNKGFWGKVGDFFTGSAVKDTGDSDSGSFWGDFGTGSEATDNGAAAAQDTGSGSGNGAMPQETGNNNIQKASEASGGAIGFWDGVFGGIGLGHPEDTGIRFDFVDSSGKKYDMGDNSVFYFVRIDGSPTGFISECRIVSVDSEGIVHYVVSNGPVNYQPYQVPVKSMNIEIAGLEREVYVSKADADARSEAVKAQEAAHWQGLSFWGKVGDFFTGG